MPNISRARLSNVYQIVTLNKILGTTTYGGQPLVEWRSDYEYNDIQQRVKPADLIASMTALPLQYFDQEEVGYHEYPYFDSWSQKVIYNLPVAGVPFKKYGTLPSWDWPLAVRKRIERTQVNLGNSMVEYRQTTDMFKSYAKAVRDSAFRIRKLRRYKEQPRKAIAGHYLGYSYGLKPIAQDLGEAVAALVEKLDRTLYKRMTTRRRGSYTGQQTVRESNGLLFDYDVSWKRIADERVVFYYKIKPARGIAYSELSFGSPIEWLWEVTPFSHVIDWGFNVGEYLASLDALDGITDMSLNYSRKMLYEHTKTLSPWETKGKMIVPNKLSTREYVRTYQSTVPQAQPPTWKPSKSWWTASNALATLAQVIPGRHYWQHLARHKSL